MIPIESENRCQDNNTIVSRCNIKVKQTCQTALRILDNTPLQRNAAEGNSNKASPRTDDEETKATFFAIKTPR